MNNLNILFYPHLHYKAQFFLRYLWPAKQLLKHGYNVKVKDPRITGDQYTEEKMLEDFAWADLVVAFYPKTRTGPKIAEVCELLDKKYIVDIDDYTLGAVHPTNPAYGFSGTQDIYGKDGIPIWKSGVQYDPRLSAANHQRWMDTMKIANALTVTTPMLGDLYAPFAHDIWVLPNSLDLSYYKPWKRRAPEDDIRIGWQGGASHHQDIRIVGEPMKELMRTHPKVKFILMGYGDRAFMEEFDEFKGRLEFHPWVDSDTYPLKLGSLDLDIGLCPVEDTIFSKGKSNLKQIEYGAFSVPSVCSAIHYGPYNYPDGVSTDGIDTFLAEKNDPDQWFDKLETLILDSSLRKEMGRQMRLKVENVYNIEETWVEWRKCYETIGSSLLGIGESERGLPGGTGDISDWKHPSNSGHSPL